MHVPKISGKRLFGWPGPLPHEPVNSEHLTRFGSLAASKTIKAICKSNGSSKAGRPTTTSYGSVTRRDKALEKRKVAVDCLSAFCSREGLRLISLTASRPLIITTYLFGMLCLLFTSECNTPMINKLTKRMQSDKTPR